MPLLHYRFYVLRTYADTITCFSKVKVAYANYRGLLARTLYILATVFPHKAGILLGY